MAHYLICILPILLPSPFFFPKSTPCLEAPPTLFCIAIGCSAFPYTNHSITSSYNYPTTGVQHYHFQAMQVKTKVCYHCIPFRGEEIQRTGKTTWRRQSHWNTQWGWRRRIRSGTFLKCFIQISWDSNTLFLFPHDEQLFAELCKLTVCKIKTGNNSNGHQEAHG